ncbi:MAG: hypothetical protein B6U73_04840 [Desulfurococcales archaeon ex4484_204]|nr:MAG: hypothetical protein B6U73_04840 [Desulfurococcales archaeon ex4484_204]
MFLQPIQTVFFHVNLPVKEGIYKIEKVYAFRGDESVVKDVNAVLRAFDRPVIYDVIYQHKLKPGEEAIVKVNAFDTSGIAKALIEVSGGNVSMVKLANGLHAYNVSLGEDPATLPVKVYVLDPYKRASRASGEFAGYYRMLSVIGVQKSFEQENIESVP